MKFPKVKRSGYIWIGVVLVVIFIVIGFGSWAIALNKGIVLTPQDRNLRHGPSTQQLNGRYISFSYSSSYELKKLPTGSSELEGYYLNARTNYEKHLAVDVSKLPGGSLNNYPSYTARDSHKELYAKQNVTVDGGLSTMFVKNDNTERTVFATHGDKVLTLSFVSTGSLDDLQTEINTLLSTSHWK